MFKFTNNTFHVTNGDEGSITFSSKDGSNLTGQLVFRIYEKNGFDSQPKYNKEFTLPGDTSSYVLTFNSSDTYDNFENPINGKEEYWYELKIGGKTVLGYDETGAKIFYLYPTGQDYKSK